MNYAGSGVKMERVHEYTIQAEVMLRAELSRSSRYSVPRLLYTNHQQMGSQANDAYIRIKHHCVSR